MLLLENVRNMLVLDGGEAMRYLVAELEELGYRWAYRLVDSRFTGVPQRRQRVIFVAAREIDPRAVLFGDDATQVPLRELMKIQAGPYHTNTRAGLQLSARILAGRKGVNKQVFMITDGKPSAIRENGRLYKNPFGLDPKIVNLTLAEAAHLRRKQITITTFMLAVDTPLLEFVRKLTELNHGRIYETDPQNVGAYVFRDFVRNRRKRLH